MDEFCCVVTMSDDVSRGRLAGGDILSDKSKDVSSSLSARQSLELFKLLGGLIVSRCKSSRRNDGDDLLSMQLSCRDTNSLLPACCSQSTEIQSGVRLHPCQL